MLPYKPEGFTSPLPTKEALHRAVNTGEIFGATCYKCDEFHNLHVDLGQIRGIIPREEVTLSTNGKIHEYAILSRVGRNVSFQVLAFDKNGNAILSRRAAQEEVRRYCIHSLHPGDVIPATVQNPADFGVFCDIGCGYTALMRIDRCCISRLERTSDIFTTGQNIYAAIKSIDDVSGRIELTGREVLGTWDENVLMFRQGQTVVGIVRSVMPYGIFVELTPNLSGLAEYQAGLEPGDTVSVYIRSILYDKHKIKLTVLERLTGSRIPSPLHYQITSGHICRWEYFPGSKAITVF